jgi:hypothetical protein
MRRRKLIVAVGLVVLVAVAAFVAWPRPQRITRENFDRIQDGMSRAEVEAILGPPGDYRTGPTLYTLETFTGTLMDFGSQRRSLADEGGPAMCWVSDTCSIDIDLDQKGVFSASFACAVKMKHTLLGNLLWRAKRQWRKWFPE